MSDVRQTPRPTSSSPGKSPVPDTAAAFAHPDGWRLDVAHPMSGTDAVLPPIDPGAVEYDVIQEPYVAPSTSGALRTDHFLGNPLLQARQIAEHLQHRYADLQRRENRLNTLLAEVDHERRAIRIWVADCEAEIQARDVEILERDGACAAREANCLELEHELQARKAEVLQQESDLQTIQGRWRDEWEAERLVLKQDLDQDRLQLENDRAHFELVKEGQLAEIQQERSLLMNRIRFQEDHLQKLRREFEVAQAAFHHERQRTQATQFDADAQHDRRQQQLDRFRQILEEREAALQRQQILLEKTRRAEADSVTLQRQRLDTEQREWQIVREGQAAELERKSEILQLNAENLEGRQARLDQLRNELEKTNSKTLEMRLAVEEACAQLAQAVGPDVARQRIEAAQLDLSQHYRQVRDTLVRHRQELEEFQRTVLRQRDDFRAEQQTLTEWIARRDEELQQRANSFQAEQTTSQMREQAWQRARERWLLEKQEAETLIRDLLRQLEEQQR